MSNIIVSSRLHRDSHQELLLALKRIPLAGSGTTDYISKWTDSNTLGNSIITDTDTMIGILTPGPTAALHITGLGADDSTYALKVNNSGTSLLFSIRDDGHIDSGDAGLYGGSLSFENISIGRGAGYGYQDSLSFGVNAGKNLNITTSVRNISIGMNANYADVSGNSNVSIGVNAGYDNVSANGNVNIGTLAGKTILTGNNVFVGIQAGSEGVGTNGDNVGIGAASLVKVASGGNVAIGVSALANTTSGGFNTSIGWLSGFTNTTGETSVFVGREAGYFNNASNNVLLGYRSGYNTSTGSDNVAIGTSALFTNTNGWGHVAIGEYAGYNNTGQVQNIFIGYNSGFFETGSNKLFIDNAQRANEADARLKALIYGVFAALTDNQSLFLNAKQINMAYLPVAAAGLAAGDLWNNGGVLNIV